MAKQLNASQLAAISGLFSASVLRELATKGRSPQVARLVGQTGLSEVSPPDLSVADFFDSAFSVLKRKDHRQEYIYKAAVTHKLLLGRHSLQTATMLTEFRVGTCKADLAILNGSSTVYEIKSERDRLDRLSAQIQAYKRVFERVNVVAGENHLEAVIETAPDDVGIIVLTGRFRLSQIREARSSFEFMESTAIFDSIQSHEAVQILRDLNFDIPAVPNTELHRALRSLFEQVDVQTAHSAMVKVLKRTRSALPLRRLVESLPRSLQPAALCTELRRKDHPRLLESLQIPIIEALRWV